MKYNGFLDDQIDVLWHINNNLARENKPENAHQIRENAKTIVQLVREQRIAAYYATQQDEPQRHGAHPVDTVDAEEFGRELIAAINKSSL